MAEIYETTPKFKLMEYWNKIPAIIRGILAGTFVAAVGILGPSALMQYNMSTTPEMPWSVPVTLVYLTLFVWYFRGRGWPHASSLARERAMAWNKITPAEWKWAGVGGLAIFLFLFASLALTYRFVALPPELINGTGTFSEFPIWIAFSYILAISVGAGVVEEAAFRGYMQNVIAARHGIWVGILVAAAMFWLAHFNHDSGPVRALLLIGGGIMFGYLVWKIGSIVPMVIVHALVDIYGGLISSDKLDGSYIFKNALFSETGLDQHFVAWISVLVLSIVLAIWAGSGLDRLKSKS